MFIIPFNAMYFGLELTSHKVDDLACKVPQGQEFYDFFSMFLQGPHKQGPLGFGVIF